jgi:hypothetical protein
VAETSSARGAITVEEVMELATCRYIDSPGVGVIDLEEPQLPEKALEVATERMFVESSIMETITSVSKVLHEYERTGGFGTEPAADAFAPPPTSESREASLPQPAEVAETTTAVAATGVAQVIVREAGSSPSGPVAAEVFKVRVPDEPAVTVQKRVTLEGTTRATSPKIQEAEEMGASLSQGAANGEARVLELACTSWAAVSESGDVSEDDEEVAMRNTLERGLYWARRAFDKLILPATSVSFLV